MTAPNCARIWLAEAIEDGRVGEAERASFQRHATDCPECNQAVLELARLRQRMSQLPEPVTSDVERHRQRAQLLERANVLVMRSNHRTRRVPLIAAMTVAVVLIGGAVALKARRPRSIDAAPQITLASPKYEVTELQEASFTREEIGGTARVVLGHGSAEFHVHHLKTGQRFLVVLPDGEIEVRGTRFVVSVGESGTRYVVVTEGKVALRRPGSGELLLFAGDRWDRPSDSDADETKPPPTIATDAQGSSRVVSTGSTVGARNPHRESKTFRSRSRSKQAASRGTVALVPQADGKSLGKPPALISPQAATATKPPSSVTPDNAPHVRNAPSTSSVAASGVPPGDLLSRGIAAFRAGRYVDADQLLQAFVVANPSDARIEDAAFLRAVSRARMGDESGAATLAREYLRRFPNGMRRPEAQALSARTR